MKKIISILILVTLLFSQSVFAADASILTLDDAIKVGLEYSKQLEIDRMNISSTRRIHQVAVEEADNIWPYMISKDAGERDKAKRSEVLTDNKTKYLQPEIKKFDYEKAVKTAKVDENALILEIYNTYYGLVLKDKDIENMTNELNLVKEKYKDALNKLQRGLISRNDYRLEYLNKLNVELKLNSLKRTKKKDIASLYYSMNSGYNPSVKPLDTNLVYDKTITDSDSAIKNALENRIEIFEAKRNLELKEKEFEIIDELFKDDTTEYTNINNDVEEAKLKLKIQELNIQYEIRAAYNELLNMIDTISMNEKEVEIQKIDYDTIKLKYELGMATQTEVIEKQVKFEKAKSEVDKSIINYIIAKKKYDFSQGIGY